MGVTKRCHTVTAIYRNLGPNASLQPDIGQPEDKCVGFGLVTRVEDNIVHIFHGTLYCTHFTVAGFLG